jgi:hypothetical protein
MVHDDGQSLKSQGGILSNCLPISFSKTSKTSEKSFGNSRFYTVLSKLITKTYNRSTPGSSLKRL